MNDRTREYLRGRFGDYYRRTELTPPPAFEEREWGYIPFTSGSGTTMIRHNSHLDLGDLGTFLSRERPRHVYFSAGRYADPGARSMNEKGWRESDLVFDLDADHLPGVDPDGDAYADMLATCKEALFRLLSFLEDDFGFEDLTVVFSGGRGYHVHVRDPAIRRLDREQRREIVDYVRGRGIDRVDDLTRVETVSGLGLKNPVEKRILRADGGWGRRVHARIVALADEVRALDEEAGVARLREFDGIGEKGAATLYAAMTDNYDEIAAGNLEAAGQYTRTLADLLTERAIEAENAPIDEPVTTDINRLIRLPGSLHGGSGLAVTRIDRDELRDFDPLVDAVPETFRDHEIRIDADGPRAVRLSGETHNITDGNNTVRECVGVFLMARGDAEKAAE
ncbi:DNA primase small subunit PriS [Halomarina halobia]|uniref:DNA primase small subunit PriS n=1 Tax=Halomarina halobia TaxID=3033386 RepID=A0ABD6A4R1_9EURY|nr:DNA primase small subunit PriS [Halomarina sp. PSR21]